MNSLPWPDPSLWTAIVPAVQLGQAADERQADAQAALGPIERLVGLDEQVEDVLLHLRGDPDARVADGQDRLIVLAARRGRDSAARIRVLRGVIQQVGDDLLQARRDRPRATWVRARASSRTHAGAIPSGAGSSRWRGPRSR